MQSSLPSAEVEHTGQRMYLPPKDDGRDKRHWLIHTKVPQGSREEMVAQYINLVASVLGSEEEAKKAMYSVSTKYYFAIGAIMPEDVAYKFKNHSDVRDVLEDAYVDPITKDYGGEPIIDGQVVPYHPKHHDLYHRTQEAIRQGMIEDGIDGFPALESYERILDNYYAKELKKLKDADNKPKRPPTAFVLFMEDFKKEFKEQNPDVKGVAAIRKAAGERWSLMAYDDQAPFLCAAHDLKMNYERNIKAYKNKQAGGNEGSDKS